MVNFDPLVWGLIGFFWFVGLALAVVALIGGIEVVDEHENTGHGEGDRDADEAGD